MTWPLLRVTGAGVRLKARTAARCDPGGDEVATHSESIAKPRRGGAAGVSQAELS